MKIIIGTLFAAALAIAWVIAYVPIDSEMTTETEIGTIGISTSGKVGVKIADNFCINPLNGQVEYCL